MLLAVKMACSSSIEQVDWGIKGVGKNVKERVKWENLFQFMSSIKLEVENRCLVDSMWFIERLPLKALKKERALLMLGGKVLVKSCLLTCWWILTLKLGMSWGVNTTSIPFTLLSISKIFFVKIIFTSSSSNHHWSYWTVAGIMWIGASGVGFSKPKEDEKIIYITQGQRAWVLTPKIMAMEAIDAED